MAGTEEGLRGRPAKELFAELRRLHVLAGEPSSRVVAESIGGMSHTTVNQVLGGRRIPSWPVLAKIVAQLGGDESHFRILWNATRDEGIPTDDLPSPGRSNHEVSVFVSYAHVDDRATYHRIRQFIRDVGNTFESMTGRDVGIFLDRSSISPGEDWKDRIKLGLSSSSIFLAFISPAYLRSVHCVQEFWEFVHFLNANSTKRLLIPLLFAPESRMLKQFVTDDVWLEASRLHRIDISNLRSMEAGSREWLERVNEVANRIEEVLDDVAITVKSPVSVRDHQEEEVPSQKSTDVLGKIAELEESMPATQAQLMALNSLLMRFADQITMAAPMMNIVATTKEKVGVSEQLAERIGPIANEMIEVARTFRENMRNYWDGAVQAILEFANDYPDWLESSDNAREGIGAIAGMANVGIESFSELDNLYNIFGQGRGLSAALDEPLKKTQDALITLGDVRGLFVGWREKIDSIQLS